jgi:hypothetical protein
MYAHAYTHTHTHTHTHTYIHTDDRAGLEMITSIVFAQFAHVHAEMTGTIDYLYTLMFKMTNIESITLDLCERNVCSKDLFIRSHCTSSGSLDCRFISMARQQ